MDRTTFLTAGGAMRLTVVAASTAMAIKLGILDSSPADKVGKLEIRAVGAVAPTTTVDDPEIIHMVVRDLPPGTTASGPVAPAPTARVNANVAPAAGTLVPPAPQPASPRLSADDDDDDDDRREDDKSESSRGVRAPREGRDDDD